MLPFKAIVILDTIKYYARKMITAVCWFFYNYKAAKCKRIYLCQCSVHDFLFNTFLMWKKSFCKHDSLLFMHAVPLRFLSYLLRLLVKTLYLLLRVSHDLLGLWELTQSLWASHLETSININNIVSWICTGVCNQLMQARWYLNV